MEKNKQGFGKLNIENTEYTTRISKTYREKGKYTPVDNRNIISFIPGTIIEILVKVGDKVTLGDELLVLEAMKMKNRIKCLVSGKVKRINVKDGDTIPKGTVLVEIEEL